MNSLIQRYRTYGEMLTELRARTSFVAQGPSANNNRDIMGSFLQDAHDYVYAQLKPTPMRKKTVIKLEAGSYLYDWHNDEEDEDIDPGYVQSVWLLDEDGNRHRLVQGITERHRDTIKGREQPVRYDTLNGQIELWPIPDTGEYGLLIEYMAGKPRFTNDSDRPGVPDRLVVLYAMCLAQMHYRMPEYQVTAQTFNALLAEERAKQHEGRRYFVNRRDDAVGEIVGSQGNWRYVVRL